MRHQFFVRIFVAFVLVLTLVVSGSVLAQDDMSTVTVTATSDGLSAPETLPVGQVTITFEASAEAPLITIFARLNEGMTPDELMGGLFAEDPTPILSQVTLKGSPMLMPGQSTDVTYNLEAGEYALLNVGAEMPQVAVITVTGDASTEVAEPEADLNVAMVDFGYGLPLTIPAGEIVWHVENIGVQWHEMAITPVEAGTTLDDVRAMLAVPEEESEIGFPSYALMPLDGGEEVWATINLEPGTYAIICHLPNIMEGSEGHLHHELGMLQLVTVLDTVSFEDPNGLFTLDYVADLASVRPDLAAEFGLPIPSVGMTDSDETMENTMTATLLEESSWGLGVLFIPDFLFAEMGMPEDASLTDLALAFSAPDPDNNPEGYVVGDITELTLNDGTPAVQVEVSGETEDNLVVFFEITEGVYANVALLTAPDGVTDTVLEYFWLTVNSVEFTGSVDDILAGMSGE